MKTTLSHLVIPGWPTGPGPESITTIVSMDSGLKRFASPRNDGSLFTHHQPE